MSVKIDIPGIGQATVNDGAWDTNGDQVTQDLLVGINRERLYEEHAYHPFPDHGIAEIAIRELGGEITKVVNKPKFVDGRIY